MRRAALLLAAGVALLAAMSPEAGSSTAGGLSGAQLGFVRGNTIFLASGDGTKQRALLPGKRILSYADPAWSRNGRLAVTQIYSPDEGMGGSGVIVVRHGQAPLS